MLPGFNHNVRYRDRVFHVQTEDNGVVQARLVTQVFIEGTIIAVERGSYADIMAETLEDKVRTERIRVRMQEQHKGQMKRLVSGEYDPRIDSLLAPAPDEAPTAAAAPAGTVPTELPTLEDVGVELPHPALVDDEVELSSPGIAESNPDFLLVLDEEMRRQTPWRPTEEQLAAGQRFAQAATHDLQPPGAAAPPADRGVRTTSRPRPSGEMSPATGVPVPPRSSPRHSQRVAPVPRPTPMGTPIPGRPVAPPPQAAPPAGSSVPRAAPTNPAPRPGAGRAIPRRPAFPPAGDTIIDMDLPGALKESIAKRQAERAKTPLNPPAQPPPPIRPPPRVTPPGGHTEAPTPVDLSFRPPFRPASSNPNDTMLEVDAGELRAQVALQREMLRKKQAEGSAPPAKAPPRLPEKKGNIVVVERSLNDVILGYLSDDE